LNGIASTDEVKKYAEKKKLFSFGILRAGLWRYLLVGKMQFLQQTRASVISLRTR